VHAKSAENRKKTQEKPKTQKKNEYKARVESNSNSNSFNKKRSKASRPGQQQRNNALDIQQRQQF